MFPTLFILATLFTPIHAEVGLTTAEFLRRDLGARALALGGAVTALGGDVESIGYNPAGVAQIQDHQIMTTYANGFSGSDNFGVLALGTPILSPLKIALGVSYFDAGTIFLNLSSGLQEKRKAEEDYQVLGTLAFKPLSFLSLGGTLKSYHLSLAQEFKVNSTAWDSGAILQLPLGMILGKLSLGASLLNQGKDITFFREKEPIPSKKSLGLAWQKQWDLNEGFLGRGDHYKLLLAGDFSKIKTEDSAVAYGFELNKWPFLGEVDWAALRLGFRNNKPNNTFHFGVGWGWNQNSGFNYTFVRLPEGVGFHHQASFTIKFEAPRE